MSDPFKHLRLTPLEECVTPVRRPLRTDAWQQMSNELQASESCPATHAPTAAVTPLGALLARHILRDGEVVLLALKPSFWWILLSSLRFIAVVSILALGAIEWEGRYNREWFYIEAAIFLVAGRIMWSVLQWMGRLYVLTDLRVIRLSGVLKLEIFDCALRKIARTQVTTSVRERVCGTGSIEIVPADETCPPGVWQTIRRPVEVHELIVSTINKAKQQGGGYNAGAAA
ncbi:MAG TPA: hypothetical protein VH475_19030 [Tepidisphaeraceae bacterium]|jgi:hypothetical protein